MLTSISAWGLWFAGFSSLSSLYPCVHLEGNFSLGICSFRYLANFNLSVKPGVSHVLHGCTWRKWFIYTLVLIVFLRLTKTYHKHNICTFFFADFYICFKDTTSFILSWNFYYAYLQVTYTNGLPPFVHENVTTGMMVPHQRFATLS